MSRRTATATFLVEQRLRSEGFAVIAGLDEVGRGAWAGPLVAAAVIFPSGVMIRGLKDSKLLSAEQRGLLYTDILGHAAAWSVGIVSVTDLDTNGLTWANRTALERAFVGLSTSGDIALVDGLLEPSLSVPCRTIIDGDATIASIAAASIIAKVTRDRMMRELHEAFPHYDFWNNKGYGTEAHRAALEQLGPSPHHRRTFAPVRELTN